MGVLGGWLGGKIITVGVIVFSIDGGTTVKANECESN